MSHEKWHRYSNRGHDKPWCWRQVLRIVAREEEFERLLDLENARRERARLKARERRAKLKAACA